MESETKRQWMQSYEGRIRVGPQYQAMIPPFCKNSFPSSQQSEVNLTQEQFNHNSNSEEFMQSYVEESLDDSYDTDITNHLKFATSNEDDLNDFASDTKTLEGSLTSSDSESSS